MTQMEQTIENVRTMQQSYDELASAAEAYNVGKVELAQAITDKGVETSPTESYPEMATKVRQITQESYTIDGGEMYEKQLFGSLDTPNYWNLYKVMEALLSHGDLVNYGGILLGEYYKGYDSLTIGGSGAPSAGAGGGYVFSDEFTFNPDGSCNLVLHTEDETHYWNDDLDEKGNRWVAWLFASESHGFTISNTDTCPRSIHIGRHVGIISNSANGRISEIVVTDGNILDGFTGNNTQNWGRSIVLRNINQALQLYGISSRTEEMYIEFIGNASNISIYNSDMNTPCSIIMNFNGHNLSQTASRVITTNGTYPYAAFRNLGVVSGNRLLFYSYSGSGYVEFSGEEISGCGFIENTVKKLVIDFESVSAAGITSHIGGNVSDLQVKYHNNDHTKSIHLKSVSTISSVEIQQGWLKPLRFEIGNFTAEMIALNILDKLGTCTAQTGSLTLKIGSGNLSTITNDPDYSSYLTDAVDNKGWNVIA